MEQRVGTVVFFCDTVEQRQAIFSSIDKLLDELPNTLHFFKESEGTMSEGDKEL